MTWDPMHVLSINFARLAHYIQLRAHGAKELQQ
jgi:hypothetical protein